MTDVRPSIRPSVDDAAERWVSFADLAEQRGISRAAASKLVRRHGWRRQTDNQGRVLILVPVTALDRPAVRPSPSDDDTTDRRTVDADMSHLAAGALAALETAVLSLTERALAAERRADSADARAERAEAAGSDPDVRELRAHATALQVELADRQAALERAQGEAAELRERADELQAGQELMMDMHARALAALQGDLDMARAQATTAHDALKAVRQTQANRKGRGLLARLRAAVRGE